jgi:hypothetical protein
MRTIVLAITAVLAVGLMTAAPSFAAPKGQSLSASFNACVSLARARGYSNSDLDGNRAAARNFVLRCMQGKGQRAQR